MNRSELEAAILSASVLRDNLAHMIANEKNMVHNLELNIMYSNAKDAYEFLIDMRVYAVERRTFRSGRLLPEPK